MVLYIWSSNWRHACLLLFIFINMLTTLYGPKDLVGLVRLLSFCAWFILIFRHCYSLWIDIWYSFLLAKWRVSCYVDHPAWASIFSPHRENYYWIELFLKIPLEFNIHSLNLCVLVWVTCTSFQGRAPQDENFLGWQECWGVEFYGGKGTLPFHLKHIYSEGHSTESAFARKLDLNFPSQNFHLKFPSQAT